MTLGSTQGGTVRKLGVVGIVVVGLLTIAQSLPLLLSGMSVFGYADQARVPAGLLSVFILPAVAAAAFGVLLIVGRRRIASTLFDDADTELAIDATSLLRLGLILVGVVLITDAMPQLLFALVSPVLQSAQLNAAFGDPGAVSTSFWFDSLPRIAIQLVTVGAGVALVATSRALSGLLWSGRNSAAASAEPAGEDGEMVVHSCPTCGTPFDPADYEGGLATPRCAECKQPLDLG
jgi:hypothetical protein